MNHIDERMYYKIDFLQYGQQEKYCLFPFSILTDIIKQYFCRYKNNPLI